MKHELCVAVWGKKTIKKTKKSDQREVLILLKDNKFNLFHQNDVQDRILALAFCIDHI